MTPDERAELIHLCEALAAEHDLTKILRIVQHLNALLDRALVRTTGASPAWGGAANEIHQPVDSIQEPES